MDFYHCGIPDSGFKRNLRLCPTGNRILGVWISGRSLVYFINFIVFDYSQPVWMLAETRLGNNCSLIIAKCERKGLLDERDSKMSGSITANISFSFQGSVNKMCFLIIIPVKRKDIWPFESKMYFPRLVQQLCSTISPIYDFQWINSCTLSSARLSAVLLLYVINSCHQCFFDCPQTCDYKITAGQ